MAEGELEERLGLVSLVVLTLPGDAVGLRREDRRLNMQLPRVCVVVDPGNLL